MHATADRFSPYTSEYLYGEHVGLIECAQSSTTDLNISESYPNDTHWLHVRALRDGYEGYIHRDHLCEVHKISATHRVCSRSTLVFSGNSIKSGVRLRLPFLSQLDILDEDCGPFVELADGGFIWKTHVQKINEPIGHCAIELAQTHFLGAPYLWGGCSPQGVDCSGLIQALANALCIRVERDSIDQEKTLANNVEVEDRSAGDIVYWPGHTGLLLDKKNLLHATAHSLSCVVEPLDVVTARAGDITSIKRLFNGTYHRG